MKMVPEEVGAERKRNCNMIFLGGEGSDEEGAIKV